MTFGIAADRPVEPPSRFRPHLEPNGCGSTRVGTESASGDSAVHQTEGNPKTTAHGTGAPIAGRQT